MFCNHDLYWLRLLCVLSQGISSVVLKVCSSQKSLTVTATKILFTIIWSHQGGFHSLPTINTRMQEFITSIQYCLDSRCQLHKYNTTIRYTNQVLNNKQQIYIMQITYYIPILSRLWPDRNMFNKQICYIKYQHSQPSFKNKH